MSDVTTLTHLNIWDGTTTLQQDCLQIRGHQIVAICRSDDLPANTPTQDCSGLSALPGLIDAHVHLELNPDDKDPPPRSLDAVPTLQEEVRAQMHERAAKMAKRGITTARDLGGGAWYELTLRDAIHRGELPGPRLLCSGQPITSVRGHCHFWGGEAKDLNQALSVLARQVDHGVDLIKVMATGGRLTKGSEPTDAQFSQPILDAIVNTAHAQHLPVAAHCHGTEGIRRAALAGVNTIEHCSWVGGQGWASDYQADVAQIILQQGVWVSPTVNRGWQRMLDSQSGKVLGRVRKAYGQMLSMGIPMVASTDAGIPGVYHDELAQALLVFAQIAQLSHEQALKSATSDAARALGISNITGTLATGMEADVLIVDGDPTVDLSAIVRPVETYCRGRVVTA